MVANGADPRSSVAHVHALGVFPKEDARSYDQNLEVGLLADRVMEATRHFRRGDPRPTDVEAFKRAEAFLTALLELQDADLDSMLERSLANEQLGSYSVSLTSAIRFVPRPSDDLFAQIQDLKSLIDTGLDEGSISDGAAGELMEFFGNMSEAMLADDAQRWSRRDS